MNVPEKRTSQDNSSGKPPTGIRSIPSEDLLQGDRQIVIIHHGETYRLLVTRNDKLLLQK